MFGLFIFGFDSDEPSVFEETVKFNIDADYDMCAYSVLTPYPGTLIWYQMGKSNSIVSYDWDKYDQAQIVYRPEGMTAEQLREGHMHAYLEFYSLPSMAAISARIAQPHAVGHLQPVLPQGRGDRAHPARADRRADGRAATRLNPPILPVKREWREAVLEGLRSPRPPDRLRGVQRTLARMLR